MDEYLETYEQEPGTTGVDKWGNEVSNTNAMLAVSHKAQGCLGYGALVGLLAVVDGK